MSDATYTVATQWVLGAERHAQQARRIVGQTERMEKAADRAKRAMAFSGGRGGAGLLGGKLGLGLLGGAGAVYGVKRGADALVGFNKELETTQVGMAGLMRMNYEFDSWGDAMKYAEGSMGRLRKGAAEGLGDFQGWTKAFNLMLPAAGRARASIGDLEEMTKFLVPQAMATKTPLDIAARDIRQLLGGRATEREEFLKVGLGFTMDQVNEMNRMARAGKGEEVFQRVLKALQENSHAAKAFGQTLDAKMDTARDKLRMFAADAGRPLFERFKGDLSTALDWLDKNKGRVDAIARTVGERLVAGWERVKGILGWVVDNHETLLATAKGIAALWVGKKALNVAHGAAGFLGNIAAARGAGGNAGGVASLLGYDPRIVSAAMKGVTTWGGKAASMFKYMRRTRVSAALMSLSAASDRAAAAVVAFAGKNGIGALTTAWKGMMVGAAGAAGYGFGTWMRSWEGFGKDRSIGEDLDAVFGWFGDLYNAKEHAERDARRHAHHLRLMEGQREEKAEARAKAQKPQAKASDRTTINVAKLEINVDAQRHEDPDRFAFDLTKHIADALAGSATSAPRPSVVPAY